ncbi:MAG: hypothetical protein KKG06_02525 [Bacteroidetes bacterium]|nr:hypothetical protein [Bacteroidota bacterium]MBU1422053.1 hypothetical protein [Bacteroidota bacterium]
MKNFFKLFWIFILIIPGLAFSQIVPGDTIINEFAVNYFDGTLQALGDTAFVSVAGLTLATGNAYASWGKVGATNVPLGALYVKEIGNGYVRVRSNSDEQVNLPIVVTVTKW